MRLNPDLIPSRLGALLLLPLLACGGGGSSPGAPSTPSEPTYSVTVTVYYDENGNGQLDTSEGARVPGVEVVIGSGTGTTVRNTGQAVVTGIRAGSHEVRLRTESLPVFYQPGEAIPVDVPGTSEVLYPVTLPIGDNTPNLYLGYGDSITDGIGSSDERGYVPALLNLLGPHFGRADVREWGRPADSSAEGAEVTTKTLRWFNPAYTLILIGTNDWHDQTCQPLPASACYTIDSLRMIVQDVKAWRSLPVLATLIPVNPALAPASRNQWIDDMNVQIGALAQEQGAILADANAAFKAQDSLESLFGDDVHPNDAGYEVLAQAWFDAISRPRSASATSSSRPRLFGFVLGD